jgi:raffinose/stachyose/melibiose transport system permease protein
MSTYMYKKAFLSTQFGYGSAVAVFIIVESIVVVALLRGLFAIDGDGVKRALGRKGGAA